MRNGERASITLIEITVMGMIGLVFVLAFFMFTRSEGTAESTMQNDLKVSCAIFNSSEELVAENPDNAKLCATPTP